MIGIDFREGKPEKSGEYVVLKWFDGKACWVINTYYNAETGRWNDRFGDGKTAFYVDMWAEMPRKENENV